MAAAKIEACGDSEKRNGNGVWRKKWRNRSDVLWQSEYQRRRRSESSGENGIGRKAALAYGGVSMAGIEASSGGEENDNDGGWRNQRRRRQ